MTFDEISKMDEFSAYFVNDAGVITGVQIILSETSQEASAKARDLLSGNRSVRVELWDRYRVVGIIDRE